MFKKAVLIVHGFAGGIYDEEPLARYLQLNKNLDVFSFTLPGHESTNRIKNKYTDWIEESERQVEFLINNNYKHIYVIGHSMGGVIASYLATKYKEIKKLVLVAPAFKYFYDKDDKLLNVIKKGNSIMKDYGYETIAGRILKASISSVKEFMTLVKTYNNTPQDIKIPTLIIQGLDDKVVPIESSKYVYESLKGPKKLVYVKDCTHDVFKGPNTELINQIIEKFLVEGIKNCSIITV